MYNMTVQPFKIAETFLSLHKNNYNPGDPVIVFESPLYKFRVIYKYLQRIF